MVDKSVDTIFLADKLKKLRVARPFDATLMAAVFAVTGIGIYHFNLAIQTYPSSIAESATPRQIVAIMLGIVAALLLSSVDYRFFRVPSYIAYIAGVSLLVVVYMFGSGDESGVRRWLTLPVIGMFQPSEIAKVSYAVICSSFLERISLRQAQKVDYAKLAFYASLPVAFVLVGRDLGTTFVFLFMFASMAFASGLPYRYVLAAISVSLVALPLAWSFILSPYQKMRIVVMLNPGLDPTNAGYQILQSLNAVGAGQLFGAGIASPAQSRFSKVPARANDFLFTVIAENIGFFGSAMLVLLYIFILLRGYHIAATARDRYGSYMAAGLTSMLAAHFIENVGMCVGIMPISGIPLPFASQGGTSMLASYAAIGVLLSVSMARERSRRPGAQGDAEARSSRPVVIKSIP